MEAEIELKGVEVIIEDLVSRKPIAVYPYRDSDDSKVTLQTKKVLLMMCGVPGVPVENLRESFNKFERVRGKILPGMKKNGYNTRLDRRSALTCRAILL